MVLRRRDLYVASRYDAGLPTPMTITAPPMEPPRAVKLWRRSPCPPTTTITTSITATWVTTSRHQNRPTPPVIRRTGRLRAPRSRQSTTSTSERGRTISILRQQRRPPPATRCPSRHTESSLTATSGKSLPGT